MGVRTYILEIANTTITVTTGVSFPLVTGNWHETYLTVFLSIAGSATEVDIEFSADDVNWVPGKDVNGTSLIDLADSGVYFVPGKVRYIRANVPAADGATIVQIQKAEKSPGE